MQAATSNGAIEKNHRATSVKREWYRIPDAICASGLGRSSIYGFIKDGKIKSVCLRKRNNQRGIRLINADSLNEFIESFVNGGI